MTTGYMNSAMVDAAVDPMDHRGLMPLAEARAIVADRDAFVKGAGRTIGTHHVLDSDVHWAALLSLEDAEEFVREARRLTWKMQPRGMANVGPFERYGAGILPWLADHLSKDPSSNMPWCIRPCLLAIESQEAFRVALDARGSDRRPFVLVWCAANPRMGYAWLLAKAEQQHPVALEAVNMLAEEDADGLYEHAIRWAGANAPSLFERLGLSTSSVPKSARSILSDTVALSVARGPAVTLASMDARFAAYDYPMWDNANYFTGAMRVTGLVSPMGDALVFQSLMTGLGDGGISRTVAPFSPVLQSKGFLSRQSVLLPEEAIVRWNADNSTTYLLTGATRSASGEWAIDERAHGPVELTLRGSVCAVPLGFDIEDLTPEEGRRLKQSLGPAEWLIVRLGQGELADKVFLNASELCEQLGLPTDSIEVFSFDDFEMPSAGEAAASRSTDIVTMVAALRERRPIRRLPSGKTALRQILARIEVVDGWGDGWPPGMGTSVVSSDSTSPEKAAPKHKATPKKAAPKKKASSKKTVVPQKKAASKKPAPKKKAASKKTAVPNKN